MDKLDHIFLRRQEFMKRLKLKKPNASPEWPVDLSDKDSQQHIRDMSLRGVEEMFEALQHLKNWKPHRTTEVKEFNKDEFLEEFVDAFNYFFSVLILTGITPDEFFDAYCKKDKIIHQRILDGY